MRRLLRIGASVERIEPTFWGIVESPLGCECHVVLAREFGALCTELSVEVLELLEIDPRMPDAVPLELQSHTRQTTIAFIVTREYEEHLRKFPLVFS